MMGLFVVYKESEQWRRRAPTVSGAEEFVSKSKRAGRWAARLYEKQVAESLGLT